MLPALVRAMLGSLAAGEGRRQSVWLAWVWLACVRICSTGCSLCIGDCIYDVACDGADASKRASGMLQGKLDMATHPGGGWSSIA